MEDGWQEDGWQEWEDKGMEAAEAMIQSHLCLMATGGLRTQIHVLSCIRNSYLHELSVFGNRVLYCTVSKK